ncbi:transposase family protein [Streptosporangium album]
MARLARVPDRRSACGLRHPLLVILTLTACATLVIGGDSIAAIWQWAVRSSQAVLERLGAYRDPLTGRYLVPSERTFRRVLAEVDADALDTAISGYVAEVIRQDAPTPRFPGTPGPGRAGTAPRGAAAAHPSRPGRATARCGAGRQGAARSTHRRGRAGLPGRRDQPRARRDPGPMPGRQ